MTLRRSKNWLLLRKRTDQFGHLPEPQHHGVGHLCRDAKNRETDRIFLFQTPQRLDNLADRVLTLLAI